jgi:DNA-binding NarL/FixJ family response regulator
MRDFSYMADKYKIKIVIIEDDETIRLGYSYLINANEGCRVVGAYCSAEEALKKLAQDDPNVVLLDIGLPGMSGIEAIPKIKNTVKDVEILILTAFESEKYIFDALSLGAAGYLTKNTGPEKIIESIQEVMNGGGPMSMKIAKLVIASFQKNPNSPLSKRETQILELVADGKSGTHIARDLFIDLETVKSHFKNIYSKLNVHSKADAINLAKRNKFI